MSTVKILYLLSEEGRKQSLLSGGDGKRIQEITAPISKEILDLASVDENGNATLKIGYTGDGNSSYYTVVVDTKIREHSAFYCEPIIVEVFKQVEFNTIQTAEQLLKYEISRLKHIKNLD